MSLRHGILGLLLLFFVLLLGIKSYEIWTLPIQLVPEKGEPKKQVAKIESPPAAGGQKEQTPIQSYIFVAENNIFSPERKEFPVIVPPPAAEVKKPIVRPQVMLYGVMIGGDDQLASVSNPGRQLRKGERELMTLKVGDRVGDYKLAKILPDRITMEAEGDTFEVLLYDPKTPKQRTYVKTETKPAVVTSTLPTPAAPAAPAAVAAPAAPGRAQAAVPAGGARPIGSPREPGQGAAIAPSTPAPTTTPATAAPAPRPRMRREPGIFGPAEPAQPE
jgi:hypothetical protein